MDYQDWDKTSHREQADQEQIEYITAWTAKQKEKKEKLSAIKEQVKEGKISRWNGLRQAAKIKAKYRHWDTTEKDLEVDEK